MESIETGRTQFSIKDCLRHLHNKKTTKIYDRYKKIALNKNKLFRYFIPGSDI